MVEPVTVGLFVVFTIIVALAFDFVNGFHDAANAIATVVATRVLTPIQAVAMAAFFNFIGAFVFTLAVANTVGKGIVDAGVVTTSLIFAALFGAIVWDLVTWWVGLPTSSSHALVGGLVGAAVAATGGWGSVFLPRAAEFVSAGRFALYGVGGGAVLFVAVWILSRLRVHRVFLHVLGFAVAVAALRYYWTHYDPTFATWQDGLHTCLQATVWTSMGYAAGALLGVMLRRPATARTAPPFLMIGALVGIALGVITKTLALGGLTKVLLFMIVSPLLGFSAGLLLAIVVSNLAENAHPGTVNRTSRRLQLVSSAFYALSHGTNDAQKTMGIIGVLLFSAGAIGLTADGSLDIPLWVVLSAHAAMGLGTFFGGWRIVKTMAARITNLRPVQGFAAETAGGVVLTAMAESGIPVSTTHAITSSIMGVGATRRASAVRWGVGRRIIAAWIVTIPASAGIAWGAYFIVSGPVEGYLSTLPGFFAGLAFLGACALVLAWASRRMERGGRAPAGTPHVPVAGQGGAE